MTKPSRLAIFATITAALAGLAALLLRRPAPRIIPNESIETPVTAIPPIIEAIPTPPSVPTVAVVPRASILTILTAGAAFACWIAAQMVLLTSRHPVVPLVLFALGFLLLQPLLIAHERRWQITSDEPPALQDTMWLNWRFITRDHPREIAAVAALTILAAYIQIATPSPFNIHFFFSSLWGVLLVPATFWLGYIYLGAQVGVIAAGFAAVSGWALALGRVDPVYSAIALLSAVYLVALEHRWQIKNLLFFAAVSLLGLLTSPLFVYLIILFPLREVIRQFDKLGILIWKRPQFKGSIKQWLVEHMHWQQLSLPLFLFQAAFMLAIFLIVFTQLGNSINPQYTFVEALSTSLLMFNLTSDPNPLHGIINQPAFSPILSAAFLVGLVGLAWKINASRRWFDTFLLWALVITLLPSALLLTPPVSYPNLQYAAMSLPVALVIAAFGTSLFIRLLTDRLGQAGVFIATLLIVAALAITLIDVRQHYITVFIPIYENISFNPR